MFSGKSTMSQGLFLRFGLLPRLHDVSSFEVLVVLDQEGSCIKKDALVPMIIYCIMVRAKDHGQRFLCVPCAGYNIIDCLGFLWNQGFPV